MIETNPEYSAKLIGGNKLCDKCNRFHLAGQQECLPPEFIPEIKIENAQVDTVIIDRALLLQLLEAARLGSSYIEATMNDLSVSDFPKLVYDKVLNGFQKDYWEIENCRTKVFEIINKS